MTELRRSPRKALASAIGALVLAGVTFAPAAGAATFTVSNTGDTGTGSLRDAIVQANENGDASNTIAFASGLTGTIQLGSALQPITKDLTLAGPGAGLLTISGEGAADPYRIFQVCNFAAPLGDAVVTISGLTITNGRVSTQGGGVMVDQDIAPGTDPTPCGLTLNGVAIAGNTAAGGSDVQGGGVSAGANSDLAIRNSTIAGNQLTTNGGAALGGGVFVATSASPVDVSIANSTITGNSASATLGGANFATGAGGGVFGGGIVIASATIDANTVVATGGDGPPFARGANVAGGSSAPAIQNAIVSAPTGATNCSPTGMFNGISMTLPTSNGNNISSDASCNLAQPTDAPGKDPLLGALADNGGGTQTQELLDGSPAIDQGASNGQTTDQRGLPRPVNYLDGIASPAAANPFGGDFADIGAFERQLPPPPEVPILRKIHYSLRFKYSDKHGRRFVTARVFCHSVACQLDGTGRIRILPFKGEGKRRLDAQTFELGEATGSFEFTEGRAVAGTLRFKVNAQSAHAVKQAILAGARGSVRGDVRVTGVNTFDPDANKRRFRDIKLFAKSRHGGANGH